MDASQDTPPVDGGSSIELPHLIARKRNDSTNTSSYTLPPDLFSRRHTTDTAKTTPRTDVTGDEGSQDADIHRKGSPQYCPSCTNATDGSISEEEVVACELDVDTLGMGAQFHATSLPGGYPTTLVDMDDQLEQGNSLLGHPLASQRHSPTVLPDYIFPKHESLERPIQQVNDMTDEGNAQIETPKTSRATQECQVKIRLRDITPSLFVLVFLAVTIFAPRLASLIVKIVGLIATIRIILHVMSVIPAHKKNYLAMAAVCLPLVTMMVALALQVQYLS